MGFKNNSIKYYTDNKEAYSEGVVNKTVSLSKVAYDLLNENVENHSPFINDLIIEALQENGWMKRHLMGQFHHLQKELKAYGFKATLEEMQGGV